MYYAVLNTFIVKCKATLFIFVLYYLQLLFTMSIRLLVLYTVFNL